MTGKHRAFDDDASTLAAGANGQQDDNDAMSVFSSTATMLNMPILQHEPYDPPQPINEPLPQCLLHCTMLASYDHHPPHPQPFCNIGLPANYARGESSATKGRVNQAVSKYRKRLGVQVPLSNLLTSSENADVKAYYKHPSPRNGEQMAARQPPIRRGSRVSLFQTQIRDLTGHRSRPLINRAVSAVYFGMGIYQKMAIFPAEAILTFGLEQRKRRKSESGKEAGGKLAWLKNLKPSKGEPSTSVAAEKLEASEDAAPTYVKVGMSFATIDLLAPPPRLLETKGPYPKEMNKTDTAEQDEALRRLAEYDRMLPDAKYAGYFFEQSEVDERFMMDMLRALERRGAIWCEAGRFITPSSRCRDPRMRQRFLVKGLFPEWLRNGFGESQGVDSVGRGLLRRLVHRCYHRTVQEWRILRIHGERRRYVLCLWGRQLKPRWSR